MPTIQILTATITETSIVVIDRSDIRRTVATEPRPESLADADTFLAVHSLGRTGAWDLAGSGLSAPVSRVDNQFNGTVAARLWDAVGTTHAEWVAMPVKDVRDGDLISDLNVSEPYVVAGSRRESDIMRVHMVREGGVWAERHTTDFNAGTFVKVARKRP